MDLKIQCDVVSPWGWFTTTMIETLRMEMPEIEKATVTLVPGEFPTARAVADGSADLGITTPPACAGMAFRGVGPFTEKLSNLRAIGSLPHDDRMMWAVPRESGIDSIEDMLNKPLRLVLPGKELPVRFAADKILEYYGLSMDLLQKHGWKILEDGRCLTIPTNVTEDRADAVIHEARKTPPWRELTQSRLMTFLPVRQDILDRMAKDYGFRSAKLTKGMLRGIEGDVPCIDFSDWLFFVRDDMPFDLAYRLTRLFVEKRKDLFEWFFRGLTPEQSDLVWPVDPTQVWRNVGGLPIHPAAEKYYKDHSYM